jgi:hypothetical protein
MRQKELVSALGGAPLSIEANISLSSRYSAKRLGSVMAESTDRNAVMKLCSNCPTAGGDSSRRSRYPTPGP